MMNRIVHFEIHAADPERAIKFYQDVFGWHIEKWEGGEEDYWIVMTADKESSEPGINGGLLRKHSVAAPQKEPNAFVCTVQVDDIDATMKKIEEAGGTVAHPKSAIAGMAWQAYYLDPEGNIFGVHQADPNAK